MKTLAEIAETLRLRLGDTGQTQVALGESSGVAQRTLTNVLSGQQDFRVSTLLALADRLGLELLLVPKGAAAAVDPGAVTKPKIPTRVEIARRQLGDKQ